MTTPRNCSSEEKKYIALCTYYKEEPTTLNERPHCDSAHARSLKARWDAERASKAENEQERK